MLSHCVRKKGGPCSHTSHTLKGVWLARCMQCAHAVPGLPQNSGYATADHGWATVEEYVRTGLRRTRTMRSAYLGRRLEREGKQRQHKLQSLRKGGAWPQESLKVQACLLA